MHIEKKMAVKKQVKKNTGKKVVAKKKVGVKSSAKKKVVAKKAPRVVLKKGKRQVVKKTQGGKMKVWMKKMGIPKWMVVMVLVILAGVGFLGTAWNGMEWALADQILGGVAFLGEDVSLKEEENVEEDLRRKVAEFFQKGWLLKIGEEEYEMMPDELGVEISIADTMRKLRQFGRRGGGG